MAKILTEEENRERLELVNLGLSDGEAARRLGISRRAFSSWRERRGIPNCFKKHEHFVYKEYMRSSRKEGVKMEKALNPEQCEIMRLFLRTLVHYSKKVPKNEKMNILKFAEAWRKYFLEEKEREREEAKTDLYAGN